MYVHMEVDISATTGAAYKKTVSCSCVAVVLSDEADESIVAY